MAPDITKPFKLVVDARDIRAGAVLLQDDDRGIDHPVCHFSKKFTNVQKGTAQLKGTTSHETGSAIFDIYVAAADGPIAVFTNHNSLTFLHKLKKQEPKAHVVKPPFTAVLLE